MSEDGLAAQRIVSRLGDIRDSIEQIRLLLTGRVFSDLESDRAVRAAFERFLEIISEASRHIPENMKAIEPEIEWRSIAAIGNQLRHGYRQLDLGILWDIHAKGQLDTLDAAAARLEQKLSDSP
ncbi:MAG: hypothetical protein Rhirs2KO_26940 [Rhizobiaceae bacterium]